MVMHVQYCKDTALFVPYGPYESCGLLSAGAFPTLKNNDEKHTSCQDHKVFIENIS